MEDNESLTCLHCFSSHRIDAFDVVGACDGNVFCPDCNCEIESDTGMPALLCGQCGDCETLMIEGRFGPRQDQLKQWRSEASGL
jgi:hypothetical protein